MLISVLTSVAFSFKIFPISLCPWEDIVRNRKLMASTTFLIGFLSLVTLWFIKNPKFTRTELSDKALLALVKNDLNEFSNFLKLGGNVHQNLPLIDGKKYTVAEGIAHFERVAFFRMLRENNISYLKQENNKNQDILTIAIEKNNPELLNEISLSKPRYDLTYGKEGWSILHMASSCCAHKLTAIIHEKSQLRWDEKSQDGKTPLAIAHEKDCHPMLNYWKTQGAEVMSETKKEKSKRISSRTNEGAPTVPDFYKKRKVPKDQIIDHTAMLEPSDRPLEATETSKYSEFAD
jgi:hypothetical protein